MSLFNIEYIDGDNLFEDDHMYGICPVCQENVTAAQPCLMTNCGTHHHEFHYSCLHLWLMGGVQRTCPTCRNDLYNYHFGVPRSLLRLGNSDYQIDTAILEEVNFADRVARLRQEQNVLAPPRRFYVNSPQSAFGSLINAQERGLYPIYMERIYVPDWIFSERQWYVAFLDHVTCGAIQLCLPGWYDQREIFSAEFLSLCTEIGLTKNDLNLVFFRRSRSGFTPVFTIETALDKRYFVVYPQLIGDLRQYWMGKIFSPETYRVSLIRGSELTREIGGSGRELDKSLRVCSLFAAIEVYSGSITHQRLNICSRLLKSVLMIIVLLAVLMSLLVSVLKTHNSFTTVYGDSLFDVVCTWAFTYCLTRLARYVYDTV